MPCVSLFPDMPRASLYITRDNQSLTMFGASLSRHKPANSWLHTNNLSTSLHLYICHSNNRLHTDNLSDCHTNSWLHNLSTFLQLNYNREVALFSQHYGQHMVNLSTGTISNLLHMDNQLHYLPRARLYNALPN
jgi:hypothetical protein